MQGRGRGLSKGTPELRTVILSPGQPGSAYCVEEGRPPPSELPLGSPSTGPALTVLPLPLRWPREPRRLCRHSLGTQLKETANLSACVTSGIFCVHSDIDLEFTCAHLRAADSERALIWLGAHPSCFGRSSSSPLPRSELSCPRAGHPFWLWEGACGKSPTLWYQLPSLHFHPSWGRHFINHTSLQKSETPSPEQCSGRRGRVGGRGVGVCLGHNVQTVFDALLGATVGSLPSLLWPARSLEPHLLLQGEFLETHRPAPNITFTQAAFMAGPRVEGRHGRGQQCPIPSRL